MTQATAPARRSARAADRRDEVLRVAAKLFAEKGFHGVSIDDLGAAVGLSGPALYRYFPGKEAILAAMLEGISTLLLREGAERVAAAAGPADALDALVAFQVSFALDHPDLIAVHARDLGSVPEPERRRIRQVQSRYVSLWVDCLRGVADGLDITVARSAVHAVIGLINSTPHSARLSRPAMRRLLTAMAEAALASVTDAPLT